MKSLLVLCFAAGVVVGCGGDTGYTPGGGGGGSVRMLNCQEQFLFDQIEKEITFQGGRSVMTTTGPSTTCPMSQGTWTGREIQHSAEIECSKMVQGKRIFMTYLSITDWDGTTRLFEAGSVPWRITGPTVSSCVLSFNKPFPDSTFPFPDGTTGFTAQDCRTTKTWSVCIP